MEIKKTDAEILYDKIQRYSDDLWIPTNIDRQPIKSNSWFKINIGLNNKKVSDNKFNFDIDELEEVKFKSHKKILLLTDFQKAVILSWMDSYIEMYNETLKIIKGEMYTTREQRILENKAFQKLKENNNIKYKKQMDIYQKTKDANDEIYKTQMKEYKKNSKTEKNIKKPKQVTLKKPKKEKVRKLPKINIQSGNIRTNYMLVKKQEIHDRSGINDPKHNTKVLSHILDEAIKDVCTSYKSAFTNLRNGNIKHFRIRYQKKTKKQKILKLEQLTFSADHKTFCSSVLGNIICTNDGSDFSDVNNGGTILYNSLNNRFTLLVPEEVETKVDVEQDKYKSCAFDIGFVEFLTGYAEDHILEIAPGLNKEITKYLKTIDKINKSDKLSNHKKQQATNKRYYKISNLIDDLHWKTANYLTKHYKTILIGNMSTKSICSKSGKLNKMTKRVAQLTRVYVFRERLKNRCYQNNCDYKLVNEKHTSQMCTFCGNIKRDLGSKRVYNCTKCKMIVERDINGGRNIYMKGISDN